MPPKADWEKYQKPLDEKESEKEIRWMKVISLF